MKKTLRMMMPLIMIIIGHSGCKTVSNEGTVVVKNGRGVDVTIPFECINCEEFLSFEMFERVINESTEIAKNNLRNPLSFIPQDLKITIINEDSLYNFETNEKIDSVLKVITRYNVIGQNAYGVEISGEQLFSFYLVNGVVQDISEIIKLEDLKFEGNRINRFLSLVHENDFIEIIPTKDKSFIVKSSKTCVDEGALLLINLENGEEIKLESWNDFNCEGLSYFNWFTRQQVAKLKSNKIESIFLVDGNAIGAFVPQNERDYFIQLINLFN